MMAPPGQGPACGDCFSPTFATPNCRAALRPWASRTHERSEINRYDQARHPRPAERGLAACRGAGLLHQPPAGRGAGELIEQALAYATVKLYGAAAPPESTGGPAGSSLNRVRYGRSGRLRPAGGAA